MGKERKELYIMDPEGKQIRLIKPFGELIKCFDWSPDSKGFVVNIGNKVYILRPGNYQLIELPLKSHAHMSIYADLSWYGDLNQYN